MRRTSGSVPGIDSVSSQRTRLLLLCVLAASVILGAWARADHLERKLFFQDEAITALTVSGHDMAPYRPLFNGGIYPVSFIRRFITPDPAANAVSVERILARTDPHHAPLFYMLDRTWIDLTKTSGPSAYRTPSVIFGLLAIAFAFGCGRAVYGSLEGGALLASLVALSPLHVVYSRQAREYALFTCLVFAATWALFAALDRRKPAAWIAYAVAITLGLYTDPLFAFVIAAHTITAFTVRDARTALRSLAFAVAGAFCLLAPWALNAARAHGDVATALDWGHTRYPLFALVEKWAFNGGAVFFDTEFVTLELAPLALLALAIVIGCVVVDLRGGDVRARTFSLALAVIPMAGFITLDGISGSHFATIARYLTAGWIGIEFVVVTALIRGMTSSSRNATIALAAYLLLIALGATSAIVDHGAENWWDNNNNVAYQVVAREVDREQAQNGERPIVAIPDYYEIPLLLAPYLRPDDRMLLYRGSDVPHFPANARDAFLVIPPAHVVASLEAEGYRLRDRSPHARTAIASFHTALTKSPAGNARVEGDDTPNNALWHVVSPTKPRD